MVLPGFDRRRGSRRIILQDGQATARRYSSSGSCQYATRPSDFRPGFTQVLIVRVSLRVFLRRKLPWDIQQLHQRERDGATILDSCDQGISGHKIATLSIIVQTQWCSGQPILVAPWYLVRTCRISVWSTFNLISARAQTFLRQRIIAAFVSRWSVFSSRLLLDITISIDSALRNHLNLFCRQMVLRIWSWLAMRFFGKKKRKKALKFAPFDILHECFAFCLRTEFFKRYVVRRSSILLQYSSWINSRHALFLSSIN